MVFGSGRGNWEMVVKGAEETLGKVSQSVGNGDGCREATKLLVGKFLTVNKKNPKRLAPENKQKAPIIKARVAVLPSPGIGHITPLLDLSKRLVLHHELQVGFLVITTNESSTALQKLLHSPTIPPGLDIVQLPPVNVFAVATDTMPVLTRLCVVVEESLRSLKSVLIELGKPKALVIDLFCTQDFQVCNELSIPVYSFFTASNALLTLSLCLPTLDREVDGEFIDLQEPAKVPGCTPIQTQDLLDQIKNRKIDEYKCGGTLTAEQLTELAYGLELSQQWFIFVVRMPTNISASAAFFNVGSDVNKPEAYLPEGFTERTQERGLVVSSWAPQVAVLKHTSTGGFLSHCERRMNASMLVEEVGVAIKPGLADAQCIVGREEVERIVKVMEGERKKVMRQRAVELKESAARALDNVGSSYGSLAGLAKNGCFEG
ncbi:hypothetical protein JCGZ_04396 [Jatropha curcas]|uniref:Glycosyltransferase n=1 Tax=Jatropha curcas TaxID=180498 RepID=A0A067KQH4_JATCU|nr:hypothetical protein JCGZ_04396 [Jatropha curcas]